MFTPCVSFFRAPVSIHRGPYPIASVVVVLLSVLSLVPGRAGAQSDCCVGTVGDVNGVGGDTLTIGDISLIIDHLFVSGADLTCLGEADADLSGGADPTDDDITINDIVVLIDHLFIDQTPLQSCGGELTYAQRQLAFSAIDSAYNSLLEEPSDSLAVKLAAFMNTLPEIDSAGVIDSVSIWGWFIDDRILLIPNNRFPQGGSLSSGSQPEAAVDTVIPPGFVLPEPRFETWPPPVTAEPTPAMPMDGNFELPQSVQAHVISTLSPNCFDQSVPLIKSLLENNGYVVLSANGTVQSLFNIDGDGVFYMDAHGGPGVSRHNSRIMGIWTASPLTYVADSVYRPLLKRHELIYMKANDWDVGSNLCHSHWRYGYTGKFVAQYMYFAPASMVFMNACMSDSVASMRDGFFTAGASVYCGWTRTVLVDPSNKAAEFMFDRLLGANSSSLTAKESPPQRPFDVDRVWQDMQNRGIDTDPSNGSRLRVRHLQNRFGLLAPSIRYMHTIEHTDTLYLLGMFGSDPGSHGRVIIGGTELPIYTWTPELITSFIPNTGLGSAGPVTVEVDGLMGPSSSIKRKSNVVNLTEWRGQFTYTMQNAGSLTATIVLDAHFRADIHRFRETPHTTPNDYSIIFSAAEDSYGTVSASGEFSYTYPESSPTSTDTWSWDGSDFVKGIWEPYPNIFAMTGRVVSATHKFELMLTAAAYSGIFETLVNSQNGLQYTDPLTTGTTSDALGLYDVVPYIYIDMSNTWEILEGSRTTHSCCSHDPDNPGDEGVTHTLTWPTILPYFPPDSTAAQ